jgi:hypothetical protein
MTEGQSDKFTERTKATCPPIFDLGAIKIKLIIEKESL